MRHRPDARGGIRAEIARAALDEALLDLGQTYGPQLESWRWGDAHQALHEHQTLGRVPFLGPLANIRQSTPGDDQTLLRGSMPWTGPEPFLNTHAAGFRGVFDFSDPDASVFIIATGESGHLLSRFYDDLAVLWRRSEYIPMSLDPGSRGPARSAPRGSSRRPRKADAAAPVASAGAAGARQCPRARTDARAATAVDFTARSPHPWRSTWGVPARG